MELLPHIHGEPLNETNLETCPTSGFLDQRQEASLSQIFHYLKHLISFLICYLEILTVLLSFRVNGGPEQGSPRPTLLSAIYLESWLPFDFGKMT